jgi:hypothetical protein
MSDRYRVTIEEDDGSGWIIGLIAGAIVIGLLAFALVYVGIPLLIGYIIYLIVRYNKKKKAALPTKCPHCRKKNALVFLKTEVINQTPAKVPIYSKQGKRQKNVTDYVDVIRYTHRNYEKCKFCSTISFTDIEKDSL